MRTYQKELTLRQKARCFFNESPTLTKVVRFPSSQGVGAGSITFDNDRPTRRAVAAPNERLIDLVDRSLDLVCRHGDAPLRERARLDRDLPASAGDRVAPAGSSSFRAPRVQ